MIPYGRQEITAEDIDALVQVCQSEFITQGPVVPRFEWQLADVCGAGHAVAVNSATSALHLACLVLGLGPGDWLWTSPITFVASANCALYCGARVDFVDIDPLTYNMSVDALESKLREAEKTGRLPKVVVPVHMCGQPCDMQTIAQLSVRYGFRVIEDASHALGARYQDTPVGACVYSDITVFSFHPVKIITTGEGGLATTNDARLAERMQRLRSHGITREPQEMAKAPDGPWYYEQIELGFNYRMNDLQAALGLSQLSRLDSYVSRRHEIAQRYNEMLAQLPLVIPWQHPDACSSFHLYVVRLPLLNGERRRREVFESMRAQGVGVNVHYIPVHTQPYFRDKGFAVGDFPEAERYYAEALSLPMYPGLSGDDQHRVVRSLEEALRS